MRPTHIHRALLAAGAIALFAACADEEPAGTPGELGNLRFAYAVPGVCDGCSMEQEILTGSVVDITVANTVRRVRYQVRSTAPDTVDFRLIPRCSFTLEPNCRERIVVTTKRAGDAELEMFDEWTGTVFDRTTVKVRDATSIDAAVRETPPSGGAPRDVRPVEGVFQLKLDSDVEIVATPRGVGGHTLLASKDALKGIYANERVVGPRPVSETIPTIEYAKAIGAGLTTVAVTGGETRQELAFHVVE